jgi:hypothetical protein
LWMQSLKNSSPQEYDARGCGSQSHLQA